jgi:hypothetical protein
VALAIDAAGKFPDVGTLLARTKTSRSELILDSDDRARLLREVPTLPGWSDEQKPVTLDLAGPVLRAKGEAAARAAEIALSRSQVRGKRVCVACDRTYLLAAMKLGFDRVSIGSDNHPVVCRDATRTYLFMPLSGNEIVPAASRPGSKRMTKSPPVTHLPKSAPAPKPVSLPSVPPRRKPVPQPKTPAPPPPTAVRRSEPPRGERPPARRGVIGGLWGRFRGLFQRECRSRTKCPLPSKR